MTIGQPNRATFGAARIVRGDILQRILLERKSHAARRTLFLQRLQSLGVTQDIYTGAQERALRHGTEVQDVLLAEGIVKAEDYFLAVARELGLGFVPEIKADLALPDIGNAQALPGKTAQIFGRSADGLLILYTAPDREAEHSLRKLLERDPRQALRIRITTAKAIADAIAKCQAGRTLETSANRLAFEYPRHSAKMTVMPWQAYVAGLASIGIPLWSYMSASSLLAFLHIAGSGLFAFGLYIRLGALLTLRAPFKEPVADIVPDYPLYSVLVALHREAAVAGQLVRAMSALDWPPERLEVLYLCEADDPETIEALTALDLPSNHRIAVVPVGLPRTKPKALNFGLHQSGGEIVVIYDAEDRPAPGQLKQAYAQLLRGGPKLACVQAPLHVTNGKTSWLSAMFAFEYTTHFIGLLPHLARLGVPLPLGGTSNHFRGLM